MSKHQKPNSTVVNQMSKPSWALRVERWIPAIFLIPAVAVLFFILVVPLLSNVVLGFFDWSLIRPGPPAFIGLENYRLMLQSTEFWDSVIRTLVFATSTVACQFILGFAFALALSSAFLRRGVTLLRGITLLPMTLTTVVAATMWKLMFEPQFGIINFIIDSFGIPHNLVWLASPSTALISVIIVETWRNTPFVALILAAGMAMLPSEPYEAAVVDGASSLQSFFFITLPLLKNAIMLAIVLRLMDALRAFGTVHVLTNGGPARLTEIASIRVYKEAFGHFDLGYGAVLAQAVFLITMIFSLLVISVIQGRREKQGGS